MILQADGLTKRFGDTLAVDGVSLSVDAGEFFSLVGPSGCGKTTTLRLLAGLESPTAGRVVLDSQPVTDRAAQHRDTNLVFQDLVLFPHMTVGENVGYGLARRGVPSAERAERVADMLETVGLAGFEERDPAELSGGQQQRVALARGLINEPAVLLLDEPLSSLDRKLKQEMRGELRRIQREVGTTFLYVTHDQETAISMSDRVAVMRDGAIVEVGDPETLYETPRTAFVADFLGDANLLPVRVQSAAGGTVRVALGDAQFRATAGDAPPSDGATVTAMVRPEQFQTGGDTFSGTVRDVEYRGFYDEYTVALDGATVAVRDDGRERLTAGDTVGLDVEGATVVSGSATATDDAMPSGGRAP